MRGEIVYVRLPAPAGKRPGLVIQNDRDNQRMNNTIIVQITTNTQRAGLDTQLLLDEQHPG
jgi:mRNA-degrading endonuclease toxin of MazEF toxin-antitoxin module